MNSAANAQEGTLLVYLDEPLALMLAAGEGTPEWDQACQKLGAEYVEKLFPKTDDELSQRYGLHRWYQLHFPSDTGVASAAEDMAKLSSVTAIQFNTTYERRFGSDAPIEWKPFAGRGYGEFNLPFNDPMLVDQWHYSGVESGVEIDIYLGLSSDYTFDLYQKVGEGPHYLYKGKYKFDGEVITGTYSDYTPWAHDYKVSGSGNSLVLTSVAVQAIQ